MIDLQKMEEELPPEFEAEDAVPFLSNYKDPLKVLSQMVRKGYLLRLRRGLYAFSKDFDPLSAAGKIYPPSYISFETALGFYGMIPEKVETIISVTDKRPAIFTTSVGVYRYYSQNSSLFAEGMSMAEVSQNRRILIANREKSLLDTLNKYNLRAADLDCREIYQFVLSSLRIEKDSLLELRISKIKKLVGLYRNRAPLKFLEALEILKSGEKF